MKVGVMFSGGKDSTMALYEAMKKGWNVKALIAVKPKNTEAYLWHYPTVEWTKLSAKSLGIPLHFVRSEGIGPENETKELEEVIKNLDVDALLLGGIGLQKTQINTIRKLAERYDKKVIVPHADMDHFELMRQAVMEGFDIRITNVATDGLGEEWLGRKLDLPVLDELQRLSKKHGFHEGGEGGYYDSFVVDGPIFKNKIEFLESENIWDNETASGYLDVKNARAVKK